MSDPLNRSLRFENYLEERFGVIHNRDGGYISGRIKSVPVGKGFCSVTTEDMYVYYPTRFEKASLAFIQDFYQVVGYLGLVSNGKYGVFSLPCLLTMNPTSVQTVKIEDKEYTELFFSAGSTIFETNRLSKDSTLVYSIYNELVSKPNMPIYFSYKDALLCLHKTGAYANLSLEKTNVSTEVVIATTTTVSNNPQKLYRTEAFTKDSIPVFNGLRNIEHGVTNLPTAIMGSYSDLGVDSIMVNPPKKLEKYEAYLRV